MKTDTTKATWTAAYENDLPDSSFLYIEPGGKKDADGKTTPRSLRHFPVKDKDGTVDKPHLRNALARIPQSSLSQAIKDQCQSKAEALAKKNGIEVASDKAIAPLTFRSVMKNRFSLAIPITKVDDDTRTIEGVATAEVVDKQGEIVDYTTAKSIIAGTWPGNLREMHQPQAVGTGVIVECNDAEKVIKIRGTVSKGAPHTWEKVKDGTLKFFSIGGLAAKRVAEKLGDQTVKRLFLESVHEISLVDNGACPAAGFAIVKSVSGTLQPVTDDKLLTKADFAPEPIDVARAAGLIAALNELLASEMWEANNGNASEPAQIDLLKNAGSLLMQFLASEFNEQFTSEPGGTPAPGIEVEVDEVAMLARVGSLAKAALALMAKKGMTAEAIAKAVNVEVVIDVQKVCAAVADRLATMKAGARHNAKDQQMVQAVHDHSVSLGASCPTPGSDADPDTDDDDAKKATKADDGGSAGDGGDSGSADDDEGYEPKPYHGDPDETVICPKCRKHNDDDANYCDQCGYKLAGADGVKIAKPVDADASDDDSGDDSGDGDGDSSKAADMKDTKDCPTCKGTGKIRAGHVTCPDCKGTGVDGKASKSGDPAVTRSSDPSPIEKLIADLQADREIQKATLTAQAATIAALTTRLETVEKQPAPGGPVLRVVEKTISANGDAVKADGLTPDVLETVIKGMTEGPQKDILLQELIKMRTAAGLGVTRSTQRIG